MKALIGKLKDNTFVILKPQNAPDFNLIESSYSKQDFADSKTFEAKASLHEDQWFSIEPTEGQLYDTLTSYEELLNNTSTLNVATKSDYEQIEALLFISSENNKTEITYTKIWSKNIIRNKLLLSFDTQQSEIKEQKNAVELSGWCDAFWDGECLYFKKYAPIKNLFAGIADYYIVATPEQTKGFLDSGIFRFEENKTSDDFVSKVKDRNLKRIAALIHEQSVDFASQESREKYQNYAQKYAQKIEFDASYKILLKTNASLTDAIKVLEENYFTSEISGEMREADTTRKIKTKN